MQLQQHNPNEFNERGTVDIVALKVDESVLMATLVLLKKWIRISLRRLLPKIM